MAITITALASNSCASPPQAQLASTQLTAVLTELRGATRSFRNAYVAEIERTQTELERAVVARSVKNRVQELSRSFGEPEWHDRFRQQGLIALSEEIEQEQDAARRLVNEVGRIRLRRDELASEGLERLIDRHAEALRASAAQLRAQGVIEAADELEARAADFETGGAQAIEDELLRAYLEAYLELGALRREVPQNLRQLTTLVEILQETHSVVHEWVMTDVKVSGADIADLLVRHAEVLDLGAPADSGGAQ
jgi:hypothetical protein